MTSPDMPSFLDERGHVPAAEMARYVDGTSDRAARSLLAQHLADCDECREELTALRRLVPQRSRMTTRIGATLGAAAAVVLITMSWRGTSTLASDTSPDSVRANAALTAPSAPFVVTSPAVDSLVPADSVRTTWRRAGADVSYEMRVQDETGGLVFSVVTDDTSALVPARAFASTSEQRSRTYFLFVSARMPDGRSVTTEPHRFRVR